MKQVLVLLALASAAAGIDVGFKYDGLRVKFGMGDHADKDYFFKIPRTISEAIEMSYHKTEAPDVTGNGLNMYCPPGRIVCPLYMNDTAGFVAALQIAAPVDSIDPKLKPEEYFVKWNARATDGEPAQEFWTATQYYFLGGEVPTSTNGSTLQQDRVWVQGLDRKMMEIQLLESDLNQTDFKKQNCVPNMGTHYYLNMSRKLTCEKQMLPWFPLVKHGKLLGLGFQTFGKKPTYSLERLEKEKDFYEVLPKERDAPKHAIPLAPECFLNMSVEYGRLSIHIYFIDKPWNITCEPGDSIPPNSASLSQPLALTKMFFATICLLLRSMA